MEDRIGKVLSLLGLTKNESKVFFDLVKHGKSSVLDISKRTAIHRTNVYDTLRELEIKGFAFEVVEGDKKLFIARKSDKIIEYVDEIKQEVRDIAPYLKQIEREELYEESIVMSKGTSAIRGALSGLLDLKEEINIYGATKEAPENFGIAFLDEFHRNRVKNKITMNHIYHYDAPERIKKLNGLAYTEARYLPKKYYSAVSTAICGDTVILFIFTNPVSMIKIKNKAIADSYNKYFEILWSKAVKPGY